MATKRKFDREPNSLRCYICQRAGRDPYNLRVGNDVVKRRRARRGEPQKTFDMVPIDCLTCGHQWFSMHKAAVTKSRKLDANIARRHKSQQETG
jgi:hypothetical protein